MSEDEDVLDFGGRRWPAGARIAAGLLAVAAVVTYLVVHGTGGGSHPHAAAHTSPPATAPPAVASPAPGSVGGLPPWPQRPDACGGTAFVPLVSARPLDVRTGMRVLVGDHLSTVDVDTGAVQPVTGLPARLHATEVDTSGSSTYTLLSSCDETFGQPATLARIDSAGHGHLLRQGQYQELVSGGDHLWAVLADESDRVHLDPLDGGRTLTLPAGFGPIAGFGRLILGTAQPPGTKPNDNVPQFIRLIDPRTGVTVRTLGKASSITVSHGVVVWTTGSCTSCRIHTYDLATGRATITPTAVNRVSAVWSGVLSADGRRFALVRQRTRPGNYDMGHPGNPNEVVVVDLVHATVETVPGLALWSKSFPGLAFSADGKWLIIGLDEGSSVRLVAWRAGLRQPLQSPAQVNGGVAFTPTVTPLR